MTDKKKVNILFVTIIFSYIAMWLLRRISYYSWSNTKDIYFIYAIEYCLKCAVFGIILYAIPYEAIISELRYRFEYFSVSWNLQERTKSIIKIVVITVSYVIIAAISGRYINHIQFSLQIALLVTIFSFVIIVKGSDWINDKWSSMIFSILMIALNLFFVDQITYQFLFALVICIAEFGTWIVASILNKKFSGKIFVCATVILGLLGFHLIEVTNHYQKMTLFINGTSCLSGTNLLNAWRQSGEFLKEYSNSDYIFTHIYGVMGLWGLVVFSLFFLILSICSIYAILILLKKSRNRGLIALGLYLIFAGTMSYAVLQEIGVLPLSAIGVLNNTVWIPAVFIAFRLFDIKKIKPKRIPSMEEIYGLEENDDEEINRNEILQLKASVDMIEERLMAIETKVNFLEKNNLYDNLNDLFQDGMK